MTPSEFDQWFKGFRELLPNKGDWAAVHGPDFLRGWLEVLAATELEDANAATRGMLTGTVPMPRDWELIAATIADAAEQAKAKRLVDQYRTSEPEKPSNERMTPRDCELCNGGGLVLCWDPRVVRGVELEREVIGKTRVRVADKYRPLQCGVPCKCSTGDNFAVKYVRGKGGKLEPQERHRYDENQFCKCVTEDVERDALAWLGDRHVEPPANFSQELASFN